MIENIIVFSHPNHEVAILGSLIRMKPPIIYLTDGGGEARVNQTKQGLASIIAPSHVYFLNHSEASFYNALLHHDTAFYQTVATQVAEIITRYQPATLYCDSIEFYNPVHDMSLPIVQAALGATKGAEIFEIPLIYQTQSAEEKFEVQRAPQSLFAQTNTVTLTDDELKTKTDLLTGSTYGILKTQMGNLIANAIPTHAQQEQFLKARGTLPLPTPEQKLRYDLRGQAHKQSGAMAEAITYQEHYVPMYKSLCNH